MPRVDTTLPDFTLKLLDGGRYQFLSKLGAGSYGVVYSARELIPNTKDWVYRAIKIVPRSSSKTWLGQCQNREATIHLSVSDIPNVVTLHRIVRDAFFMYYVMDYCDGGDLGRVVRKKRTFGRNDALVKSVFLQIVDGVAACHKRNVFHRDIKPENIMVSDDLSVVMVGDFGLSTRKETSISFNTGSGSYMCPECIECTDTSRPYYTRRADVWALGLTLINLVTGRLPWRKATVDDEMFVAFLADPNFLRTFFPISTSFNKLLRSIFTIDPRLSITIEELRERVADMDTFWMSRHEIEASNSVVRYIWKDYRPRQCGAPWLEEIEGYDTSSSSSDDIFESLTSSEYTDSLDAAPPEGWHDKEERGIASQDLANAEEGFVGAAVNQPLEVQQPRVPSTKSAAAVRPTPRTKSSDEFPIRNPGGRMARVPEMVDPTDSPSSASDEKGPVTPETRPLDPPGIIDPEPLDLSPRRPQLKRAIPIQDVFFVGKETDIERPLGTTVVIQSLVSARG